MSSSRHFTPIAMGLSLVCVLALTACAPGDRQPTNESGTQQASNVGQRSAGVIRDVFQTVIEGFTEAAGGTWTYMGGSAFSASDRKPYMTQPCGGDDGRRQLLMMVTSGPNEDGPAAIDAERASGQFVSYRTNDLRTTVRFGSECSSDPTMLSDLD